MKRLLSLLLVALCSLPLLGCATLLDTGALEQAKDYFSNLSMQEEQESGAPADTDIYREDTNSYGYYYDQLAENSRVVYRTIYLDRMNCEGISIVFREALSFSFSPDEASGADAAIRETIGSMVQPALDALLYDHPEVNWISMEEGSGSTFSISSRKQTKADGSVVVEIRKLTFRLVFKTGLTRESIETEEALLAAAIQEAGDTLTEEATRYEVLCALQEYLCRSVTYQSDAARAHEAVGALLDHAAVCDGYAKAFKLLCDAYDIPCLVVPGTATQNGKKEPHAWNYVQMEDGKWYGMDVTWDDGSIETGKNYFLVGSGTVTSITMGCFGSSHQENGKFSAGNYTPFTFPELSFFRYTVPVIPGLRERTTALS